MAETPPPDHLEEPGADEAEPPQRPLLTLRDGLPPLTETEAGLAEACAAIAGGTGSPRTARMNALVRGPLTEAAAGAVTAQA